MALTLLAAIAIDTGGVRADTLSDCKTGAPAVALKACTALLEASTGQDAEFEARYYRALAYGRLADFEKAEADLTVVVKARPKSTNALALRGETFLRRGRLEPALADLDAAIQMSPTNYAALGTRGELYTRMGNFQAAKADLDKAIALAPQHPRAYDRRGVLYRMMGSLDLALADHNAAVAFGPSQLPFLMNRADLHVLRKAYDLAIADYDRVLSVNADYPRARQLRESAVALKGSQTALAPPSPPPVPSPPSASQPVPSPLPAPSPAPPQTGPPDAQAVNKLFAEAEAHLRASNWDLAIVTLNRIIALVPNSARAFIERGQAFAYKNDFRSALADFNRALAIDANNVAALLLRAQAFADTGDVPRGIMDCEAVVKLLPADPRGMFCRGVARAKGRDWSAAIDDLTKAIDGNLANPAVALVWRGKAYLETDAYEAAGKDADKALALNPQWAFAVALKGNVLLAKGQVDQALGEFERALKLQRNNLDAVVGHSAALIAKTLPQHKTARADKE